MTLFEKLNSIKLRIKNQKLWKKISLLIILAALPISIYLVKQTQIFKPFAFEIGAPPEDVHNLTSQLIKAAGDPSEVDQLIKIAQERQQKALDEIQTDPANFLLNQVTEDVRDKLPNSVQDLVEQDIKTQGSLEVAHTDNEDPAKSSTNYYLQTDQQKYQLHFANGSGPALQTGDDLTVTGKLLADQIVLQSSNEASASGIAPYLQAAGLVKGTSNPDNRKLLVIPVKFYGQYPDGQEPFTPDEARQKIFTDNNSIANYFRENSYSQLFFTGDVSNWLTIKNTGVNCRDSDKYNWRDEIEVQAKLAGIDLEKYSNVMYLFGENSTCTKGGSTGWGLIGGRLTQIYAGLHIEDISHELGHNLGLEHAGFLPCEGISAFNGCRFTLQNDYGDPGDAMGNKVNFLAHFNGLHKVDLGWVASNRIVTDDDVCNPGSAAQTFTLSPLEINAGIQVVKVKLCDYDGYLYLDYRAAIGTDVGLIPDMTKGVSIHLPLESEYTTADSFLINPNNTAAALAKDETYHNSNSGVFIKTLDLVPNVSATVQVGSEPKTCNRFKPTLTFIPTPGSVASGVTNFSSLSGSAGSTLEFALRIDNHDSDICGKTSFSILPQTQLGKGWDLDYDAAKLVDITAGTSASIPIRITSPSNASDDIYPISIDIVNSTQPDLKTTANLSYTVSSLLRTAQNIPSPSISAGSNSNYLANPAASPNPSPRGLITGPYPDLIVDPDNFQASIVGGGAVASGGYVPPGKSVSFSSGVINQSTSCISSHLSGTQFYTSFSVFKGTGSNLLPTYFYATAPLTPPLCTKEVAGRGFNVSEGSQWVVPSAGIYTVRVCVDNNGLNYSPGGNVFELDETAKSNCYDFTINSQNPTPSLPVGIPTPPPSSSGASSSVQMQATAGCSGESPFVNLSIDGYGNNYFQIYRLKDPASNINPDQIVYAIAPDSGGLGRVWKTHGEGSDVPNWIVVGDVDLSGVFDPTSIHNINFRDSDGLSSNTTYLYSGTAWLGGSNGVSAISKQITTPNCH